MGFTVERLVLTDEQRDGLERRVRAHTSSAREVRRARSILLCEQGMSLAKIGVEVGMDQHKVGEWRKRFLAEGLDGLEDRPRPGRPRRIGHDERMQLAAIATSEKDDDNPVPMWTYADLADAMFACGIEISPSQVGRILNALHIDVTKVRGWLNRRDDPAFWERVRDVCGIYLNCPDNAIVLSIDEKTSVQAKERKQKTIPAREGRRRRVEWEYIRHGTASLFAAMNVHNGEVLAEPIPGRNDSANFCAFLDQIDRTIDPAVEIHVVLDNGSSHTSKYTKAWFEDHPRWVVPLHAAARQLGQPGRVVLLDPATQGHQERQLQVTK